jgi:hypothetical protein
MELAHPPDKKETYEDYVGIRGLKQHGKKNGGDRLWMWWSA